MENILLLLGKPVDALVSGTDKLNELAHLSYRLKETERLYRQASKELEYINPLLVEELNRMQVSFIKTRAYSIKLYRNGGISVKPI